MQLTDGSAGPSELPSVQDIPLRPDQNTDAIFTLTELNAALSALNYSSCPGLDGVTYSALINLNQKATCNSSTSSIFSEKLTLFHVIMKPATLFQY